MPKSRNPRLSARKNKSKHKRIKNKRNTASNAKSIKRSDIPKSNWYDAK